MNYHGVFCADKCFICARGNNRAKPSSAVKRERDYKGEYRTRKAKGYVYTGYIKGVGYKSVLRKQGLLK